MFIVVWMFSALHIELTDLFLSICSSAVEAFKLIFILLTKFFSCEISVFFSFCSHIILCFIGSPFHCFFDPFEYPKYFHSELHIYNHTTPIYNQRGCILGLVLIESVGFQYSPTSWGDDCIALPWFLVVSSCFFPVSLLVFPTAKEVSGERLSCSCVHQSLVDL